MSTGSCSRQYTKPPDFGAANFVMDFQMDIIDIDDVNILIKKGPNLNKLTKIEKEEIASVIMEIWTETAHQNRQCVPVRTLRKLLCLICCCFIVDLAALIAVIESNLHFIRNEENQEIRKILVIALGVCLVIILLIISCGMLLIIKRRTSKSDKWRNDFVRRLCGELIHFGEQRPDLIFSVIYPIPIWSRHSVTSPAIHRDEVIDHETHRNSGNEFVSAIWCHLRVTEGAIVTAETEPIYDSTQWNMRKESGSLSRITGITSTLSLEIADYRSLKGNVDDNKLSKKGNVQTGKFPIAKRMGYKQLT